MTRRVNVVEIIPADYLLIRNVREIRGTGKLKSYWESNIFVVLEERNLPVYTLNNINKANDNCVIHRNLLMKCNDLPVELFQAGDDPVKVKKKQSVLKKQAVPKKQAGPKEDKC